MVFDDVTTFDVVRNAQEQYSIWPAGRKPPDGWTPDGVRGSREECLRHIETVWTDLRPRALREAMR